jgi:hypothetical protein
MRNALHVSTSTRFEPAPCTLVTSLAIRASVSYQPPPIKTSPSVTSAILAQRPAANRALSRFSRFRGFHHRGMG